MMEAPSWQTGLWSHK